MIDLIKPMVKHCPSCSPLVQTQAYQFPGIHILAPNMACGHIDRDMTGPEITSYVSNVFHMVEDYDIIVRHMLVSQPTLVHMIQMTDNLFHRVKDCCCVWSADVVDYSLQWGYFMCLGWSDSGDLKWFLPTPKEESNEKRCPERD